MDGRSATRRVLALLLALAAVPAPAADVDAVPGLVLTRDGAHVVDVGSKLAWPRCVEGMRWNGQTCTGEPRRMTHAEATAWAASRARADGVPWRLPRVTELRRWSARNGKAGSATARLFPAAPLDWYWTMTTSIETREANPYSYDTITQGRTGGASLGVRQGWAVNMASGDAEGGVSRQTRLVVRLVANQ